MNKFQDALTARSRAHSDAAQHVQAYDTARLAVDAVYGIRALTESEVQHVVDVHAVALQAIAVEHAAEEAFRQIRDAMLNAPDADEADEANEADEADEADLTTSD